MEHMSGGDLQQYLASRQFQPVPIVMARSITHQIGQALRYLHNHNIIHRDIKLENIMLTSHNAASCKAKLADFGLAETVKDP